MRPTQRLALIAEMVPGLKENRSTTSVAEVLEKSLGGLARYYVRIMVKSSGQERLYGPWRAWDFDGCKRKAEEAERELGQAFQVTIDPHQPGCDCVKCERDSLHVRGLL